MLGCLVSDISSPFSSIIVKGINSVCTQAGYQLLLVDSEDDPERERTGIQDLLENRVDGLVVNTAGQNDEYLLSLHQRGIPLVLADRCLSALEMIDTVATENYHITYQCITYLRGLGYEQVAFFTQGNRYVAPRILRFQAYSKLSLLFKGPRAAGNRSDCYRQGLEQHGLHSRLFSADSPSRPTRTARVVWLS